MINGNKIWIRAIGRPEYKEGTCIKVYGTFQNINDLKSTELENKRVSKLIEKLSNELPFKEKKRMEILETKRLAELVANKVSRTIDIKPINIE